MSRRRKTWHNMPPEHGMFRKHRQKFNRQMEAQEQAAREKELEIWFRQIQKQQTERARAKIQNLK